MYASCGFLPSMLCLSSWLQTQCKEHTWTILVSKLLLGWVNRFVPKQNTDRPLICIFWSPTITHNLLSQSRVKNRYWRSNSAKFCCALVLNSCAQVNINGYLLEFIGFSNAMLTLIRNLIIPICRCFSFSGRKGAWCRGPVLLPVRLCSAAGHKCQGLHWLLCRFCNGSWGYG